MLINSFVYSNSNYGPLIWHFTTRKGINKIEKVQERSLKFLLNDYDKTYFQLLDISKKPSMEVKRLRIVIVEIFKRLHDLNPIFMKDIFHYCQNKSQKKHNLHNHNVHSRNTSRYGYNSLRVLGAHIWNRLPENIKCTDSAHKPKNPLKGWHHRKRHPRITTRRHPPQQNTQREGNGRAVGGPPDLIRFLETVFFF